MPDRASEPFGDLLSIAGRLQTAYGFAGEWADATGLIQLRARYYEPTTGRFVQPDPFPGVPTRPISQNPYPYANDNPLTYTDPSGRNPVVLMIIAGAALGGFIGLVGGGAFARMTYNWAYQGQCGCEMRLWAFSIDGTQWVKKTALIAGAIGAVAGAIAAAAPIGEIVIGLAGTAGAGYDLYHLLAGAYARWQTTAQLGFTPCELLRFVVDLAGIIGGYLSAQHGVEAALESGSPWYWIRPPVPAVRPGDLEGLTPDEVAGVLSFARRGTANDGGPKWTWMRDGIEWEARYHEGPNPNPALAGTRSARGSTIKFGVRVAGEPGTQGPVPDVYVQAADAELVRRLGIPMQNLGRTQYVDRFGYAYLDNQGAIRGLRTDATHLLGAGHPDLP